MPKPLYPRTTPRDIAGLRRDIETLKRRAPEAPAWAVATRETSQTFGVGAGATRTQFTAFQTSDESVFATGTGGMSVSINNAVNDDLIMIKKSGMLFAYGAAEWDWAGLGDPAPAFNVYSLIDGPGNGPDGMFHSEGGVHIDAGRYAGGADNTFWASWLLDVKPAIVSGLTGSGDDFVISGFLHVHEDSVSHDVLRARVTYLWWPLAMEPVTLYGVP